LGSPSFEVVLNHVLLDSGVAFLQKPFTAESLGQKVRHVLDSEPAPVGSDGTG
jgi:hypothetical protein